MKKLLNTTLLILSALLTAERLSAQSDAVTQPFVIPLYHPDMGETNKWGIYLSIGNGTAPALFELDTGGTGFYAAYSTNAAVSPWWGSDIHTNTVNNGTNAYDSGLTYNGNVVAAGVSFWTSSNAPSASLVSPTNVLIGQSTNISQGGVLWSESGSTTGYPPINGGSFYGDFGLSLNYASNALVNIIAQMTFTNGILPGFLINTPLTGTNGYLQIGLTSSQTNAAGFSYFAMNTETNSNGASVGSFNNNTNISYKSEQLFNATMSLTYTNASNVVSTYSTNIGITPDTGATPKLHNTTNDPNFPNQLIDTNISVNGSNATTNTNLISGVNFTLSATNNANELTEIINFTTTNGGGNKYYDSNPSFADVNVQNSTNSPYTNYYYNAGLYLFNQHQVIYDLQNGAIGLGPEPVPEPSAVWLLLAGLGFMTLSLISRKAITHRSPNRR